ncbi:hypothetical protein [Rahnella sp. ChDrAdgB13]|uniref:hypothetical protein n=1 Tax=Rahnella sp. ChDrAdgB13 TaxID=1850581 RepID=UPI001AD87185|nr:hypothetical protein [Rahnella sp. ChDrAdgB13]
MAGKRPDGKVFASGASDGEVLDFPSIERGWGVTLDGKDPDGNSVTDATDGIPPMEWDNSLQHRIDSNILWLLQNALPEWAAGTWPVKSVVVNNDIVYRAVKETAVEPTASAGDWTALFPLVSLDGRYSQVSKNLADLDDKNKAKENLSLDKVGNYAAVQQGGGTGMESNKVYVGWDGEKLIVQVDSTAMGELFYGGHPPTAAQTGAYPQTGGNVGGHVNATYLSATQQANPGAEVQGTFIGWNESGGQGESDFINNRGGGLGGFIFRIVNSENTAETGRVTISGTGDLNTGGTLSEAGQRVYSPGNPQPQQDLSGYATTNWVYQNFITGMQIGARVTVSGADSSVVPQGAVGIASMTVNDDRVNQIVYAYPMYAVNGNWVNAG